MTRYLIPIQVSNYTAHVNLGWGVHTQLFSQNIRALAYMSTVEYVPVYLTSYFGHMTRYFRTIQHMKGQYILLKCEE